MNEFVKELFAVSEEQRKCKWMH